MKVLVQIASLFCLFLLTACMTMSGNYRVHATDQYGNPVAARFEYTQPDQGYIQFATPFAPSIRRQPYTSPQSIPAKTWMAKAHIIAVS